MNELDMVIDEDIDADEFDATAESEELYFTTVVVPPEIVGVIVLKLTLLPVPEDVSVVADAPIELAAWLEEVALVDVPGSYSTTVIVLPPEAGNCVVKLVVLPSQEVVRVTVCRPMSEDVGTLEVVMLEEVMLVALLLFEVETIVAGSYSITVAGSLGSAGASVT